MNVREEHKPGLMSPVVKGVPLGRRGGGWGEGGRSTLADTGFLQRLHQGPMGLLAAPLQALGAGPGAVWGPGAHVRNHHGEEGDRHRWK